MAAFVEQIPLAEPTFDLKSWREGGNKGGLSLERRTDTFKGKNESEQTYQCSFTHTREKGASFSI